VTESTSGLPLPGVTVLIKGTTTGAVTDIDGKYSINASSTDILVFSYMGYLNEEVQVGTNTVVTVDLVEDIIGLDEVIVTGYGVQKKSDLTGAVASVSSEKLTEMPSIGVDQALQGRAAGVSVVQATGMPGANVQIQIRGISSTNGSDPLVIVDGVISSLDDMNPNDIQSIEILKDASSTAIYGSAGGNGVILVTTKKGKEGKLQANLNYYRGWQNPWKKIDMLTSQEYAAMRNYNNLFLGRNPYNTMPDTLPNYDYEDIMMRTGIMEEYDFSVTGGNEKSTYFASANYSDQNGILYKSQYQRLSFRLNSDHKLGKIIKVGQNANFSNIKRDGYDENVYQNEYNTPVMPILQMYPFIAPYDENGDWVSVPSGENPVVARDVLDRKRNNYNIGGNAFVDLMPFKGLIIKGVINGYVNHNALDEFTPEYNYSGAQGSQWSRIYKHLEQYSGWQGQVYATYNVTLAEIVNVGVMAGYERTINKFYDMEGERRNLINETPEYRYFDGSSNDSLDVQNVQGAGWADAQDGIFGRINAEIANQFLLTVNVRHDRSSRFGPEFRAGTFPSFSLGWKFSELDAVKNFSALSFGKIRFGYGTTGANAPDRYAYYAAITSSGNAFRYNLDDSESPQSGSALVRYPNPLLHWETVKMSNLGIDLTFFQNSLNFTMDVFRKKNEDMILLDRLPSIAGYYQYISHQTANVFEGVADPLVNKGSVLNDGIEISVGYKKSFGELDATFDFNTTLVRNKVIDLDNDSTMYRGNVGVNLSNVCYTSEGYPISQFDGYVTDGLFSEADAALDADGDVYIWNQPFTIEGEDTAYAQPNARPGDLRYIDQNGDNVINAEDRVNIGSPIPKIVLGFSTSLNYKNFDFNLFLEGKFGHKIFNGSKFYLLGPTEGSNVSRDIMDQYRSPVDNPDNVPILESNTSADALPRMNAVNYSQVSDFYVESGNYVRLRNIQLGYTLPLSWTEKAGIEKFRVYAGVKNLLTITKYTGFDPEVGYERVLEQGIDRAGNYPHARSIIVGVNLQF
jgi:TonB-linked SusC/RagA family outer membrane protein